MRWFELYFDYKFSFTDHVNKILNEKRKHSAGFTMPKN